MNKIMRMNYSSSISSLCEVNSSFDKGVLRIAYTGENRNGSYISKDTFERCIGTMYNCPIVCNYDRNTQTIGGHDMDLISNDDGDMRLVNVTMPVGVIPESSKYFWDIVKEDDGTEHEYLCADALIWKRQEAYQKIKEDGITAHSMELTVKDGEVVDGVFVINDFEFTAFCLLGDDYEPCFESSALAIFSYDELKHQLSEMMSDLKKSFSMVSPPSGDNDTRPHKNYSTEGGEKLLEEKLALIAQYGFDVQTLDFSIEDLSMDDLKNKLDAKANAQNNDGVTAFNDDDQNGAFALASQLSGEIENALCVETVERCWGEMPRYQFVDYDVSVNEVYCYDAEDWKLYGFTYSTNGDNVIIDFTSKKRVKFAIVDFDEGEQFSPFSDIFEMISKKYTENDTKWSDKYQTASDEVASMQTELEDLRQFKKDIENDQAKTERENVLSNFEELNGIAEFDLLVKNCEKYELSDLEEKCYAIKGRNSWTAKPTGATKPPKLKVDKSKVSNEPYGGIFIEYGETN